MSNPNENKMIVGYSPGDFFYSTVQRNLNDLSCNNYLVSEESYSCNTNNFKDEKKQETTDHCINIELCKNNNLVKQMYGQNKSKWGTDELNYDTLAIYRTEYIFMCNLGIATIGMLVAIYYLYPGSSITTTVNSAVKMITEQLKLLSNQMTTTNTTTATKNNAVNAAPQNYKINKK